MTLINGQKLEATRKHAKGDPQNALSESELKKKAFDLMVFGGMTKPTADALLEKLGGDSINEMLPRFQSLRRPRLSDLRVESRERIFWPEENQS